jgi:uncharacterized RDD family membrane protein YckC
MAATRTDTLTIETPEGIVFSLQLAGPLARFLAWCIDMACIAAITGVLNTLLGVLGIISRDIAMAAAALAYFIVSVGYGMAMEWFCRGQTVGKRLLCLRVADAQGLRLQFSQIAIRNLMRFVDSLPAFYLVGGMACLLSVKAQRLGDLAGNTIVVWIPRISQPDLKQLLKDSPNSFTAYPQLCARLRQRVLPREADLAIQAILRRDELADDARVKLFKEMADYFSKIVAGPQEAGESISDEQYGRNMADILFSNK